MIDICVPIVYNIQYKVISIKVVNKIEFITVRMRSFLYCMKEVFYDRPIK